DNNMKREAEIELVNFINEIINDLCIEKEERKEEIDELAKIQNNIPGKSKKCPGCFKSDIDNKKKICPDCRTKLPTIASTDLTQSLQSTSESEISNKFTVFKPYIVKKPEHNLQKPRISITQKSVTDHGVQIPDIYVPDPIPVNPNSTKNVKEVLKYIEGITGIASGKRKWLPVVCDGVPYNY